MICLDYEQVSYDPEHASARRCLIQADTKPDTLPTTGENVTGLPDEFTVAAGSVLRVLDTKTNYIMGEDGTWYEQ